MQSIKYFEEIRKFIFASIKDLSRDQLLLVPEKATNNIWWNVAHLVVVQERIHYQRSGLSANISEEDARYIKGSSPSVWQSSPDQAEIEQFKERLLAQPKLLSSRYESGEFQSTTYDRFTTSVKIEITSIEEAIEFINFHEGVHLGVIMALKKQVF